MIDLATAPSVVKPAGPTQEKPKPQRSARAVVFNRRARLRSFFRHFFLILFGLMMLYPLLWMIASSVRPNDVIFREPGLVVTEFDFSNYTEGWNALAAPFSTYLLNTAIIVFGSIVGTVLSCALAAYAFARLRFRFKKTLFAVMLVTIMLPMHVVIVPQYIVFSQMGLVNTFWPLLLPKFFATESFYIFLMVQFIRAIPRELDEAARLDGCGFFGIFWRIILPLLTPALAATAVFTFISSWNDFFSALIYLTDPDMMTVPVALRTFVDAQGESNWGGMFAMSIVSLVPVLIAFIVGQKYLVQGISTTGGK